MESRTSQPNAEAKKLILAEEKIRLGRVTGRMRSREVEFILEEESPFYRRRGLLATLFEILIGIYTAVLSIFLILVITKIFS